MSAFWKHARRTLFVVLLMATGWPGSTALAGEPAAAAVPERVKVGLFITQLYDLDIPRRSFNVSFWAWFLHADDKYKPLETAEIVNAKNTVVKFSSVTAKDDVEWNGHKSKLFWDQGKYTAVVSQDWEVASYPFDRQVLQIQIEDGQNDVSETIFEADTDNSRIDGSVSIPGWTIESFTIKARDSVYQTTYGDPTLQGTSTYSRVVAAITVKRNGLRLLCSTFIGFFVAFALTCLTFWLDTDMMAGSRIGLCGGAIFASVGNKYVVDNTLPPASTFTLSDAIEASTFLVILFAILVVVLVRALNPKHPRLAQWINYTGAALNTLGYLTFNGLMIARAAL